MLGITILGNNSALPAFGRHPTAQVVTVADEIFLVDCGEGTQLRLSLFKVKRSRITRIFISHLHGDHFYGLVGLINTMNLLSREQELHIHGPEQVKDVVEMHLGLANTILKFNIRYHFNPEAGGIIYNGQHCQVSCFPVKHRIPCWGYRFDVKKSRLKLLPDKARDMGVPQSFFRNLVHGEDYHDPVSGATIPNALLTHPAPAPPSYAYCADTLFFPEMVPFIQGVHTIYHESTFLESDGDKASSRFHSTARQAATIAAMAGVQHLLLGHFSSRYENLDTFLAEAKSVFPNTSITREGVTYLVADEAQTATAATATAGKLELNA